MKMIVELPKSEYESAKENARLGIGTSADVVISEGTPLPERHGDLVDKYDILHDIDCDEEMRLGKNAEWVCEVIRNAPTVIKATENTNKEESK